MAHQGIPTPTHLRDLDVIRTPIDGAFLKRDAATHQHIYQLITPSGLVCTDLVPCITSEPAVQAALLDWLESLTTLDLSNLTSLTLGGDINFAVGTEINRTNTTNT